MPGRGVRSALERELRALSPAGGRRPGPYVLETLVLSKVFSTAPSSTT